MAAGSTLGVVAICHGYPEKIPGWLDSVRALNRKPDKIVLVLWDQIDKSQLDLTDVEVVDWFEDFAFSDMMNAAVENCKTDWIAWIGIDDRYRPHALDLIDKTEADVLALGFEYDTGQIWSPNITNPEEILSMRANMIPCGSPFKRWLWERIPFDQNIAPSDDWQFWLGTALSGASYDITRDLDVDYEYAGHWVPNESECRAKLMQWLIEKRGI